MGWLARLFDETLEASATAEMARNSGRKLTAARIDFHIKRYALAIEQCEKGGDRMAQLRAGLAYWIQVRSAHDMEANL